MLPTLKSAAKAVLPPSMRRVLRDAAQLARYATPNPLASSAPLSPRARGWLDQLNENGIVRLDGEPAFAQVASYLEERYFKMIESDPSKFSETGNPVYPWNGQQLFVESVNTATYRASGTEISCSISFGDPGCEALFFNEEIAAVLSHYYRRQPYFRNQPLIQKITYSGGYANSNGGFHVDHLHQMSVMLLVTDVTEKDTHMEYCVGSHRRNLLKEGIEIPLDECAKKVSAYPLNHCVGPKGTAFLFDTSGFHRANYLAHSTRKILHLNYTTGHNMYPFVDRKSALPQLAKSSSVVSRMFNYLA